MPKEFNKRICTIKEFHEIIREMVQKAIKEEMMNEFQGLRTEAMPPPIPTQANATVQKQVGSAPQNVQSQQVQQQQQKNNDLNAQNKTSPNPNMKIGDNVLIPGTSMNLNKFLQAASSEQNFQKKKDMLAQASQVLTTLNTMEEKKNLK